MTISFVAAASAEANTLTLPTHQAGDLIVLGVARFGSVSLPTVPSGWLLSIISIDAVGTSRILMLAAKIAASAAETSGTWTNANLMAAAVYRDTANIITIGGSARTNTRNTTSVIYPGFSIYTATNTQLKLTVASSFVLGAVAITQNTGNGAAAPSGMTNRVGVAGVTTGYLAIHDTDSAVASWAQTTVTASGNVDAVQSTMEVYDLGYAKSSGNGFRAVNIRGGADQ